MKVGFLGFGEVALNLSGRLTQGGAEVYTSIGNRSAKTRKLAKESTVKICEDNQALAELSDILISSVTPENAVNVAKEVGKYVNGIYVDLNNISPQTAEQALGYIENGKTADAALMGRVRDEKVLILATGEYARQFSILNKYGLQIKVLNHKPGQAKALKMLRSSYTKSVSALLFESLYTAYNMGLDEEFLKCLEITEGPHFKESATSRIKNSAYYSRRKAMEMDEVINFIKNYPDDKLDNDELKKEYQHLIMVKAAQEFFKKLKNKQNLDEKPENYRELFNLINAE